MTFVSANFEFRELFFNERHYEAVRLRVEHCQSRILQIHCSRKKNCFAVSKYRSIKSCVKCSRIFFFLNFSVLFTASRRVRHQYFSEEKTLYHLHKNNLKCFLIERSYSSSLFILRKKLNRSHFQTEFGNL